MLLEIHIQQFALIEEATLELSSGLNVLTGETGAGKSIVIDAVMFLLGGRASAQLVRTGAFRARVEGRFDVTAEVRTLLESNDLQNEDDPETLLLARELTSGGKNTVRINGNLGNLTLLQQLGELLVDIHGQHEHQSLLRTAEHLRLLDRMGDAAGLATVSALYEDQRGLRAELQALRELDRERARQEEWLRHEVDEIERAVLQPGEEAELDAERNRLAHAEKIRMKLEEAHEALHGGEPAATTLLGMALRSLDALGAYSQEYGPQVEALRTMASELADLSQEVRHHLEAVHEDPARLDEVQARLELIGSLKRKYGESIEAVLDYAEQASTKLHALESSQERMAELEALLAGVRERLLEAAEELSRKRQETAGRLQDGITKELQSLGMAHTRFVAEFHREAEPGRDGLDRVEFMISPNPGEPLRPLHKIASGGELSRLMLALKSIFAEVDRIPSLIFDEVDAGLGGLAASAVAERLRTIAKTRQVICVTHAPILAAAAHTHWHLSKQVEGERTRTRAECLNDAARVREVARMLSGAAETSTSMSHAQELLKLFCSPEAAPAALAARRSADQRRDREGPAVSPEAPGLPTATRRR
ncbi:MAG: DNA repair protein RecN [Candidatus Xenobia bacterium]